MVCPLELSWLLPSLWGLRVHFHSLFPINIYHAPILHNAQAEKRVHSSNPFFYIHVWKLRKEIVMCSRVLRGQRTQVGTYCKTLGDTTRGLQYSLGLKVRLVPRPLLHNGEGWAGTMQPPLLNSFSSFCPSCEYGHPEDHGQTGYIGWLSLYWFSPSLGPLGM